jgi:hypothetical protein
METTKTPLVENADVQKRRRFRIDDGFKVSANEWTIQKLYTDVAYWF